MSQKSRKEYVEVCRRRYLAREREARTCLLNEFCEVTGHERKYAIKLLGGQRGGASSVRSAGRPASYADAEVKRVVKRIWQAAEQPCGKLLRGAIDLWLPYYEARYGKVERERRKKLLSISAASLDRMLRPHKAQVRRRSHSGTRPGTLIKQQIPIRTEHWEVRGAGFVEADTVAHCGGSLMGDFIWSVTLTDIHSSWTELRGVWNKGEHGVVGAIQDIEAKLPFALLGFDSDNGGEFLNWHLVKYFSRGAERQEPVYFTRSRPYRKNDNAHVEQKNWTHARQLLGYTRLENERCVAALNSLYEVWCQLHNFFRPCFKLLEKKRIGARYQRKYDQPKTPAARLLAWKKLPPDKRAWLKEQMATLDPFRLQEEIEKRLRVVFELNQSKPPKSLAVEGSVTACGLRPPLASLGTASTAPSTAKTSKTITKSTKARVS